MLDATSRQQLAAALLAATSAAGRNREARVRELDQVDAGDATLPRHQCEQPAAAWPGRRRGACVRAVRDLGHGDPTARADIAPRSRNRACSSWPLPSWYQPR